MKLDRFISVFRTLALLSLTIFFVSSCQSPAGSDSGSDGPDSLVSDGTATSPVALTLGSAYSGQVAKDGFSYYTFTATTAGDYRVAVSSSTAGEDLYFGVFSNTAYDVLNAKASTGTVPFDVTGLSAGSVWYLRVLDLAGVDTAYTLTVSYVPPAVVSDGSIASPVVLTVGTPFSGKAGEFPNESYYSFTTNAAGRYRVTINNFNNTLDRDMDYKLYSDSGFTTVLYSDSNDFDFYPFNTLAAATTYYLKARNVTSYNITYTIVVNAAP